MFSSAKISLVSERLGMGRGDTTGSFPPIDVSGPLRAIDYAIRDRILSHRDALIARAYNDASYKLAELTGIELPKIWLECDPEKWVDPLNVIDVTDVHSDSTGVVRYVSIGDVPADALDSDASLWARDVILLSLLKQCCSGWFSIPCSSNVQFYNFWPLCSGKQGLSEPHKSKLLCTDLYNDGDTNLAWRDNHVAAHIANMSDVLRQYGRQAQRVSVTVGQSMIPCALSLDDGRYRVFSFEPIIDSTSRCTRYDSMTSSVNGRSVIKPTGYSDSRSRLFELARNFSASTLVHSRSSSVVPSLAGDGFVTESGVFLTNDGNSAELTNLAESGCAFLLCKPCKTVKIAAKLNTDGYGDDNGVTLNPLSQARTWSSVVPSNSTVEVSVDYTSSGASTYPMRASGLVSTVAAFVSATSTARYTFSAIVGSSPEAFSLQFIGSSGQVTIKSLSYKVISDNTGTVYSLKLDNGLESSRHTFYGTFDEYVVVKLPCVGSSSANLELISTGGVPCSILVESVQCTSSSPNHPDQNSQFSHTGWKSEVAKRIVHKSPESELETKYNADYGLMEFTNEAYAAWSSSLGIDLEDSGPADVGQLVVMPFGTLEKDGKMFVSSERFVYKPVAVIAQPWMIAHRFKTFGKDFWTDTQF